MKVKLHSLSPAALASGIFVLLCLGPWLSSAEAADADNGKRLSERWCSSCHIISVDQKSATTDAPQFSTIAKNPGFDAAALAFFLLQPHPKMPDIGLSREAAADLAAFIATQR